jgi:GAF domain-containing protein
VSDTVDPTDYGAEISGAFAGVAKVLYEGRGIVDVYAAVCATAPAVVPGCDHCSLMLATNDHFETAAASDEMGARVDELEREVGEGPCLDAVASEDPLLESDLTRATQWPRLTPVVLERTPIRGMAGFRMLMDDRKVGALNLFSRTPGALTGDSVDRAAILVSYASVALMAAHRHEGMETLARGLESNREIGKALGLMMAFHKISDTEAFEVLRRTSQDLNRKLADIASEIVSYHNKPQG